MSVNAKEPIEGFISPLKERINYSFCGLKQLTMASASSSSSFMPNAARKYDVFISFRGEDTRHNFTSHLHAALKLASLEVFLDDKKLEKGDEIAPSLIQAIKNSSVSVVVLSENYASSRWCLNELSQIMQYRKEGGKFVIPIFYKVDPSHVRNIKGTYKEAFEEHEKKHGPDRLKRWRAALFEAANLIGWHCNAFKDETNLIQEIVVYVNTKLEQLYNCEGASEGLIGIDEMIKHKVGIWGNGGMGKTTMAKEVFNRLSSQYNSHCFLENVREKTEKKGSEHVSNFLVSKLLGQDMQGNSSNDSINDALVARKLSTKKALVVLDDVDSSEQLKDLLNKTCNSLGLGSKVIITTRDKKLLQPYGYEIHKAKGLSYDNSRRLFIHKAFGSNYPDGYEQIIKEFVDYTKHNPLALEVLGSLVCSEDKEYWDDLLTKLRQRNPKKKIRNVLRMSYVGLDTINQQIFLDIACLLKGESEEFVQELLESYGFYPNVGLRTLKDRSLLVSTNGKIEMHDLIQEMGHQIVHEEKKKPGQRSRLWDSSEIYNVFKNHEGKKRVEGIRFFAYGIGPLELIPRTFNKMTGIRFLNVYSTDEVSIPTGLESISNKIRYFRWEGYPGKYLPSNFCCKLLLELNLTKSRVETLWEGVKNLVNLRRLKLRECQNLKELPDFSKACRLESVDLSGCSSLCIVHESLLCLQSLISLDVSFCSSLESLESGIHLESLKQINAYLCKNLKEFSVSSKELMSLYLSQTKIEQLRPSIGRCSKLTTLHLVTTKLKILPTKVLSGLTSLEKLSISNLEENDNEGLRVLFDHLRRLQSLSLKRWWNLKEIPHNIMQLSSLKELYLKGCCSLTKLPDNMRHLPQLQILSIQSCSSLQSLPELPQSLRILIANYCTSLERVSTSTISSTSQIYGKRVFSFIDCVKLDFGTIEEQAMLLLQKAVHEREDITIYYPGRNVPNWLGENWSQHDFGHIIQLSLSSHNLVGFIFCVVIPESCFLEPQMVSFEVNGMVLKNDFPHTLHLVTPEYDEMGFTKLLHISPGNVLLLSNPKLSDLILEKIEGNRRNHEATTYNHCLFFKFTSGLETFSEPISECEVYPIYASEYSG